MNEQIFQTLLSQYKNRGISLDRILRDPVFLGLPLEDRIRFIRAYSNNMSQGIRNDSRDTQTLINTGLAAGAGAYALSRIAKSAVKSIGESQIALDALPADGDDSHIRAGLVAKGGAAILGGLLVGNMVHGAVMNAWKSYQDKKTAKSLLDQLNTAGDNKYLTHAVQLLSDQSPRAFGGSGVPFEKIVSHLQPGS
jgi:hypothetical protein